MALRHPSPLSLASSLSPNARHPLLILSPSHRYQPDRRLLFSCSAERESRNREKGSRPVKSNAEICDEIREFISQVGLPKNRVPSTKELAKHGRKDLANIVRRRGYKVIKEFLVKSENEDSNIEEGGSENFEKSCEVEASEYQQGISNESEDVYSSSDDSSQVEYISSTNGAVGFCTSVEICEPAESFISSLHEKATNFIQTGELDPLEDDSDVEIVEMPKIPEFIPGSSNGADTATTASNQILSLPTERHRDSGNDIASLNGQKNVDLDRDLSSEMDGERDSQTEINRLKLMLRQKETELEELKEQIEKEKLALSILQARAATEIGNAKRIVSAIDLELRTAEQNLSGLKEVQIECWANGETVEVAGSFNGWHNRIKMDLLSSSKTRNELNSGNSKLWSTVLWLYPGIYEIKFIVDGNWTVDSQREVTAVSGIMNNVLQVDS